MAGNFGSRRGGVTPWTEAGPGSPDMEPRPRFLASVARPPQRGYWQLSEKIYLALGSAIGPRLGE